MLLARDDIGIQDVEHHTAKENQVSMLLNADRKKNEIAIPRNTVSFCFVPHNGAG